jgi:hypothetical protein
VQDEHIHKDLMLAQQIAYEPHGFICTNIKKEAESEEYGAYEFNLNQYRIKFRAAKITPTKIGQFVTLWKRIENGPIMPYDITDPIDFYIVSTRHDNRFGQFIFPKSVMLKKGILSNHTKGGKRATRVYPPWDMAPNQQAKKTQQWQLPYFFEIINNQMTEADSVQRLFSNQ